MPSFSKNAILIGQVDHFCLVCEAHLKCEEDVLPHIGKAVHKKSLDATQYVDTFKKDRIRKTKNGYFCEFCNILMTTLAKVRVHVETQNHVQSLSNLSLTRVGKAVVALGDIAISERAWNGLQENSCAICNTEYENDNIHKTQPTHVLNLVQISVEFDKGKNIYRKMDESTFHCLTCNLVLALNSLTSHWDTDEHKNKYEACRNSKQAICISTKSSCKENVVLKEEKQKTSSNESKKLKKATAKIDVGTNQKVTNDDSDKNNAKIFDSLSRFQENGMLINFETETAHCKVCTTSLNLDFEIIEEHIRNHKEKNSKKTTSKPTKILMVDEKRDGKTLYTSPVRRENNNDISKNDKESIEKLAMANKMECNSNSENIICKTCNKKISYSLTSLKDHIAATAHQKNLQNQNQKNPANKKELKTVNFSQFVKSLCDTDETLNSDVIVNEEICITYLSTMFITQMSDSVLFRCHACEEHFIFFDTHRHLRTVKHSRGVEESVVVTELDTEFIREIRRNNKVEYHCGYCNIMVSSWENMTVHVTFAEHTLNKNRSAARLRQHAPKLEHHKIVRNLEQIMRMRMGLNM